MFNKVLLASIALDKKKLKENVEGSCYLTAILDDLTEEEKKDVVNSLNNACNILRQGYIRKLNKKK